MGKSRLVELPVEDLLLDYRWVYKHPDPTPDEIADPSLVPPGTVMLRKIAKDEPSKFIAELAKLEKVHQEARIKATDAMMKSPEREKKDKPSEPDAVERLARRTLAEVLEAARPPE